MIARANILLFFGAPLAVMAVYSLLPLTTDGSPPHLSFKAYSDFFSQPAYVQAIWNSVITTAIVVETVLRDDSGKLIAKVTQTQLVLRPR